MGLLLLVPAWWDDNGFWLYHCGECDHAFHCHCVRHYEYVKLEGTIKLAIKDENHTLAFGFKEASTKELSPLCVAIVRMNTSTDSFSNVILNK